MIFNSSLKMLDTLNKNLIKKDGEIPRPEPGDANMEPTEERVHWATIVTQNAVHDFEELLQDLRQSYTAVKPLNH
jgi:hypothetical protein